MALPSNVGYGQVVAQWLWAVADSTDPDTVPDALPASGTVTFTASIPRVLNAGASPNPVTIGIKPIVCNLDADGYLIDEQGNQGVYLVATDDPDNNPTGWTYSVQVRLDGAALQQYSIEVPEGGIVDLSDVAPVPSSDGTAITRGRGIASIDVDGSSHLIVTYTDGSTSDAGVVGSGGGVANLYEAPGDLVVGSDNGPLRLPVGTLAGAPLSVDPAAPSGLRYADTGDRILVATAGGAVTSGAFGSTDWGPDPTNTGAVKIRRIGQRVTVSLLWVRCLTANGTGAIVALPAGFRGGAAGTPVADIPIMPTYSTVFLSFDFAGLKRNQGTTQVGNVFGRYTTQQISWDTTDPWPATLPGDPA